MDKCLCCGIETEGEVGSPAWACPDCEKLYPPSLIKAAADDFSYALGLEDGTRITFGRVDFHGEWVTLWGDEHSQYEQVFNPPVYGFRFSRGLDVRLDTITWCADAPMGS